MTPLMLMMEMMIDRIKPGKSAQCTDVETLHEEFSQAMNDNDENLIMVMMIKVVATFMFSSSYLTLPVFFWQDLCSSHLHFYRKCFRSKCTSDRYRITDSRYYVHLRHGGR